MNKKFIALLLAACLALSVAGAAHASFDHTVFAESEGFQSLVDPTVGAGSISYLADHEQPIGQLTSDNDYFHFVSFDVFLLPNTPAVMRAQFAVAGTLNNARELTLRTDENAYTVKVDSNPSTAVYESVQLVFSSHLFPLLEEVVEKQLSSLDFRLDGDFELNGQMPINLEAMETLFRLYQEAGGLEQDFTKVDEKYPVTVEALPEAEQAEAEATDKP